MSATDARAKLTVVFFDEAVAFGGGVVVLSRLFRHIDRDRFVPRLVTGLDRESCEQLFDPEDVLCRYRPPLGYVARARWMDLCPTEVGFAQRVWAYLFSAAATLLNAPTYVHLSLQVVRARPNLLHGNSGRDAFILSRLLRIPLVWHLHGPVTRDRGARRLQDRVARVITISKFVSSTAVEHGLDPKLIEEIPNPAPVDHSVNVSRTVCLARFGVPADAFVMAHVGRLLPWKGQLEFLRAFIRIAPDHPGVMAVLAGEDLEGFRTSYALTLRTLVEDAGVSDRVVFAGHVANVLELMSSVDLVVHSSIEPEPFGLVITEAMSVGTAVIAANLGAPAEIIEHEVTGLLVDPRNTEQFADGLALLIGDASRRRAIAEAGQRMVRERYSPKRYARRVEAVYETVLRERQAEAAKQSGASQD